MKRFCIIQLIVRNKVNEENSKTCDNKLEMSSTFKTLLDMDKKTVKDVFILFFNNFQLHFIVGYRGFRRGVKAENYYGKNFRETSLTATNNMMGLQK